MIKQSLLLVDADRLVLATLKQGLQEAGYDVLTADNGDGALQLCQKNHPDLAILDMRMPGINGIQVAHWLREHTNIPFIFLSAYNDEKTIEPAVEEGALAYMVKPVDIPQLLPMILAALNRGEEIRQLREKERNLSKALTGDRVTSTAVGIIMYRYNLSEKEAFERLRRHARSQRQKLAEVARGIVSATENLNKIASSQS